MYILHSVSSHHQVNAVHFVISAASGLVQHALLLHVLGACGLMHNCLNWFQSYLTGRLFLVKIAGVFLFLEYFLVSHKALCLGVVHFNISIDDTCIVINHSKYIYLVGDIRFFHVVKSCNWMVTFILILCRVGVMLIS